MPEPVGETATNGLEAYYSFDDKSAQDSGPKKRHGKWEGSESYGRSPIGQGSQLAAEPGCKYSAHSCVCRLRCPTGLKRTGDGSVCSGKALPGGCDLGWCHEEANPGMPICDSPGIGQAASFDGSSRIVIPRFNNFQWRNKLSVSLWFRRTDSSGFQGLVSNGFGQSGSFEVQMGNKNGGAMLGGGVVTPDHPRAWDHVTLRAKVNDWHHVAMVYDGRRLNFYVDGQVRIVFRVACNSLGTRIQYTSNGTYMPCRSYRE